MPAARTGGRPSGFEPWGRGAFVEDALRAYLKTSRAEAARVDLRAVLDRLAVQNPDDLSDEEAMELAVEEVRAVRAERRSRT
jgi:hypothetical protein